MRKLMEIGAKEGVSLRLDGYKKVVAYKLNHKDKGLENKPKGMLALQQPASRNHPQSPNNFCHPPGKTPTLLTVLLDFASYFKAPLPLHRPDRKHYTTYTWG